MENRITDPMITVLMPVYNAQKYLRQAIESILEQTFCDFEFIIVDDGSTDDSAKIISSYEDPRIVYIKNEKNMGIVHSLNMGIEMAKGKYIARMDADDISVHERFEKQYHFMHEHTDIGLCGSAVKGFGAKNRVDRYPVHEEGIRALLLFNSAFAHPAIMIRRDILLRLQYQEAYRGAEDYELWTRCIGTTKCANLPDVLLLYRHHEEQTSSKSRKDQWDMADAVRLKYLQRIHSDFLNKDAEILGKIARREFIPFRDLESLMQKILHLHGDFFDQKSLEKIFALQYWWTLGENCSLGEKCFVEFLRFYRHSSNRAFAKNKMKFFVKCLLKWRSG